MYKVIGYRNDENKQPMKDRVEMAENIKKARAIVTEMKKDPQVNVIHVYDKWIELKASWWR